MYLELGLQLSIGIVVGEDRVVIGEDRVVVGGRVRIIVIGRVE